MILQFIQVVCLGCAVNMASATPTGTYQGKDTSNSNAEGIAILVFTYIGVLCSRHLGSTNQELLNAWCSTRLRAFLSMTIAKLKIKPDETHYYFPDIDPVRLLFLASVVFTYYDVLCGL
jgi:hypothetical protein